MKLLSIETSCDDTAITVIEFESGDNFNVLIDIKMSQIDIHSQYGGVYPDIAKREHIKNLPIIIDKINSESISILDNINYIAVTSGPGLSPALWPGIEFAKNLSKQYNNCPVYSINHLEGHIFSSLIEKIENNKYKLNIIERGLALLVSGGHTEIVLIEKNAEDNKYKYKKVGQTLDDAAGECFDKSARSLGIAYPGGPVISKLASIARQKGIVLEKDILEKIKLPRPMINTKDYNFSFSGLKTAVADRINKGLITTEDNKEIFAMEIENAIIDCLIHKIEKAFLEYNVPNILLGGGVSANLELRNRLQYICENNGKRLFIPSLSLAMDNSLMIAAVAYYKIINNIQGVNIDEIKASSRWSIEDCI